MFCPHCGNQLREGELFCSNCGTRLNAAVPNPQQAYQQPAPQQTWQQPNPQQTYQQTDAQQAWQQPDPQQAWQQPDPQQAWQQTDAQQAWQQPAPQQAYQPQSFAQPVAAKKRSKGKGVLIGVGCVALAALVGGGIWFLTRSGAPRNKLLKAAAKSLEELKAYTADLPNLHSIAENADAVSAEKALHMDAQFDMGFSYGDGGYSSSNSQQFRINMDLDGAERRARITGSYAMENDGVTREIPASVYLDQDQLQLGSSALLEEGEALSIPIKDLAKQWNASALAKLADFQLPEDLDLTADPDRDLEKMMLETYGEDWTKLKESFDTVPYEGTPHFGTEGVTYTLTWDRDALKRMSDKTDLDLEDMFDINDPEDLARMDLDGLGARLFVAILGELNEQITQQQFYVEDGVLTGIWLQTEEDDVEVEIRLCGENNPWEHVISKSTAQYESYSVVNTEELRMEKSNGQLRLIFSSKHEDSEGESYSYEEGPYTVIYNDADGKITFIDEDGEAMEEVPELHLTPAEQGFTFNVKSAVEDERWSRHTEISFTVSGKLGPIAPISTSATKLLQLSEQELKELAERIQNKLDALE